MSSGDKAKPPATFEERNPFDISRRSGTDVAGEIAKRMAAWKQARSRSREASGTIPSAEEKQPTIAAPVQPTRAPRSAVPERASRTQATAPATRSNAGNSAHVPYFALSAVRRAMPPAPSLKQGGARPQAPVDDEPALRCGESAVPIGAIPGAVPDQVSPRHDEPPLEASDAAPSIAKPETPLAGPPPNAADSIEETALEAAAPEPSDPVEPPSVDEASEPIPVETGDTERGRAEARAIKARWMAAHDLDALIETPGAGRDAASAVEAAIASAPEPGGGEHPPFHAPQAAAAGLDSRPGEKPEERPRDELAGPERHATLEAPADGEEPAPETAPETAPEVGAATRPAATDASDQATVPDEATGRPEAPSDARVARVTPALVAGRDVAWEAPALGLAALDEMAGRREPTFDAPAAPTHIAAQDEAADEPGVQPAASAAAEPATVAQRDTADEGLSIVALDEVAGRKEPTFDAPVRRPALEIEPPAPAARDVADQARKLETRMESRSDEPMARGASEIAAATSADHQAVDDSPDLRIAALDQAAGRKEPTFDEPVRPNKPAAAQPAGPRVALRPIETRIEVRRIDTLRADPELSAHRPIFPHIEPEEWEVLPPVVAAQARLERRGTGWAIGLGTVLLIAGITAPAAIWQQGRQAQDQVALVNPAPATPQDSAPSAPAATTSAQAPAQPTLPEAPPPETMPPAPAVAARDSSVPNPAASPQPESPPSAPADTARQPGAPNPAAPTPEADQVAANPAATLRTIGDSEDVNEAPVVAPPPPTVNLASKPPSAGTGSPMVARPFVPEQGSGPFLRAPTTGTATVPVAAAPVQSAGVGVKPNLMGQLKPKATVAAAKPVASKPRPVARKPKPFFQQSPEQMFDTLIETLSEGKPVNPATKPEAPSSRR